MTTATTDQAAVTIGLPVLKDTGVGNYFVANYPPFGAWRAEHAGALDAVLQQPPEVDTDLGLYVHIPFCRKRCHFCYFRVYTDKNAQEIRGYIDAVLAELSVYARTPLIAGRTPRFIYFGGGTPSYLSSDQLRMLTEGMKRILPWDGAQEIALEAEPGTLNEGKLRAIREMGVTRLSLGIEHFDDHVLEINGRAHRSKEIDRAYDAARSMGFAQINIDLIAGMVEENEDRWQETVAKAIALAPDSVTIYQMEVPYNTTIYQRMKAEGRLEAPVANWETKRRWVAYAFEQFERAGFSVVAATTVAKDPSQPFMYRSGLFNGTDLLSVGVSSFGYLRGVNYQNEHNFKPYIDRVGAGERPVHRAYSLSADERYIREFALQMKGGSVEIAPFTRKFGRDPREQFAGPLSVLRARGVLDERPGSIGVTREGLMQVDRLIYEFFKPEHQTGRYA